HRLEKSGEVGALHWQQLFERGTTVLFIGGKDHGAHMRQAIFREEHVLSAAEADAFGAECAGLDGVAWNVSIRANADLAMRLRPTQQPGELWVVRVRSQ